MKRLLIASTWGLAILAAPAFAQSTNSSDVYQYGSSNTVGIDQALNTGTSNTSTVNQGVGGNSNAAYSSSVAVTQIGGSWSGATTATTSDITQNDSNQHATVTQNAWNDGTLKSTIIQNNYNNTANVTQTSAEWDGSQKSYVEQIGQNGSSTVNQTGVNDKSYVSQSGQSNSITVGQSGYSDKSYASQTGQYGSVSVNQSGSQDRSAVNQSGYGDNGSWAGQWVNPGTGWTYVSGGVNVTQSGLYDNHSYVAQDSDYSGVLVQQEAINGSNSSYVAQLAGGSSNYAYVHQH
jgi:trimeric autotransporter adhesin